MNYSHRAALALLTTCVWATGLPLAGNAAVYNVINLLDSGAGSLRDAINQAEATPEADQINFQVGGTLDVGSIFPTVTTEFSISSNGFNVILDGTSAANRAFTIDPGGNLSLSSFTLQNFASGASSGGAINVNGGTFSVSGSTFTDNVTDRTGGAIRIGSNGSATINTSVFTNNDGLQGGAIAMSTGSLLLTNSQITNNTASLRLFGAAGLAGGISAFGAPNITIQNSDISNNTGERSNGGIFIQGGTLDIDDSSINNNESQGSGEDGGGLQIASGAQVTITDSEINDNTAASGSRGGGIHAQTGGTSVTIERTTIDGNTADGGGGINVAEADLTVIQSTISNNDALNGGGGGISAASGDEDATRNTVIVENSTISGNTSSLGGGGLIVSAGASGEIDSSTIADNDSGSANGGGLRFSTEFDSTFEVQNSIFSGNIANGATNTIGGGESVDSGGHNLFDDDGGGIIASVGDLFNADADLQPLADNGGPTFTHALGALSDAIDTGSTSLGTDQRGYLRPVSQQDIGAYEFGAPIPEPTTYALLTSLVVLSMVILRRRCA
ncbi:right-handed parallel beta-helix repeat-containing protein [Rubellicoccus peritrichatus]|uniref:Right-handed parallel beta-helix repeat-containing protein n=1 Tax=Rubellicoccus peritrichatus TaxID=3080537 RepID=A0AAQ3L643_9BACT|nr:right-handed parallel beta-helix repeat-containing protein [Puniceicoccus sp. CR14]WOO39965.1 right-handed parallel beta-helix repeat-containing protein [Puniceicoccus sp. CR14]